MAKAKDLENLIPVEVDPLEALLSVDTDVPITAQVYIPRLRANFTVRAPKVDEFKEIRSRCFYEVGKGKKRQRFFDSDKFAKLLVFTFTVNPDFTNPKLAAKYGGLAPEDVVTKALLPGEIEKLGDAILELGGWGDDDEANLVEEAKN